MAELVTPGSPSPKRHSMSDNSDDDDVQGGQRERLKTLIANSDHDQKIYRKGMLNKTSGGRRRKNWKRRFFLLSETALAYFTEDNTKVSTTLKGGVLLTNITDVREAEPAEAVRPYMFIVSTPTRDYRIQAPTEFERTEWIASIREAAEEARRRRSRNVKLQEEGGDDCAGAAGAAVDAAAAAGPVVITYFPLRGRAERLRLLLADIGVEWVEKPPLDWPALKAQLLAEGMQGTLPLVEYPDGTRSTQTSAAMRHFARVHERYGETEADKRRSDVVAATVEDWRLEFDPVAYHPGRLRDTRAVRAYANEVLPTRLRLFETMLSSRDAEYVAGRIGPTFADVMAFDCLDAHLQIDSAALDGFPRLRDFVALMRARPRIAAHVASRPPSDFGGSEMSLAPDDAATETM